MALTKAAIVQGAAREAKGILGALPGLAADAAAQYVKQGTPSGVIPNLGVALARQACRRHAQQPNLAPDGVSATLERVCRPYLDDIGYGSGPGLDLPFRGGQCAGVFYDIRGTYTSFQGTIPFELLGRPGPIGAPFGFNNFGGNSLQPGYSFENYAISTGQNAQETLFGSSAGTRLNSINVTRSTAGADNCGNPPTTVIPPTTPTGPVITIEPIIIVPILDVDADVTINVDGTIDVAVDGIEVNIDLSPEAPGGGGGVGPTDLVPDGGLADSPSDTGNGGTAAGQAPDGQELVGVRVAVLEAPIGFNQYANNSAVIYRGVGYVRMGYPGRLALDVGGSALISPQFFLAPVRGLTNWEVRANLGFINRVTPFYRALPS